MKRFFVAILSAVILSGCEFSASAGKPTAPEHSGLRIVKAPEIVCINNIQYYEMVIDTNSPDKQFVYTPVFTPTTSMSAYGKTHVCE